jgi:putative ABC transport system permease protein
MWRNYLVLAFRTAFANWTHSVVNIVGLSVGLASCILILLFVQDQRSYEAWLPNADRVAQLQTVMDDPDEGPVVSAQAARPAAAALAEAFPQVEEAVAMTFSRVLLKRGEDWSFAELYFVDPGFLRVFDFPLVRGDRASALAQVGTALVTESEALRQFGTTDVVGRVLTINSRGNVTDLRITGVLRDLPANSHLRFTIVTPFDAATLGAHESEFRSWSRLYGFVYARLRSADDAASLNPRLGTLIERHVDPNERPRPSALRLVPIRDIHLGGAREDSMKPAGDSLAVSAFAAIALLILLIACMNFANLATVQSTRRAREVALRKLLGARRVQLAGQFLGEAMLITFVALVLALALVELFAPTFGAFMGAELGVHYLGPDGLLAPALILWVVVGLVCGFYPATLLSRFPPARLLRSARPEMEGSGALRNFLVVAQFAIAIALIVCTAVVYAQTEHARRADPGFDASNLLIADNLPRLYSPELQQSYIAELRRIPGVASVGLGAVAPGADRQAALPFTLPGRSEPVLLNLNFVDPGFVPALGMPVLAGRSFEEARPADDATVDFDPTDADGPELVRRGANLVLSASAARRIGARSPAEAIGRRIFVPVRGVSEPVPATVIGVVGDVQLRSMRDRIRPAAYLVNRQRYNHLLVRFEDSEPAAVRAAAATAWRRLLPNVPFEGAFAEERLAEFYADDAARGRVFAVFAGIAIVISCMGLFGLAAFTAERRTKEIGIRKVLGARTSDILRLLLWQFSRLVLVANLIAWPVAWWLMRDWLNGFAQRISLHPGWFVGAGAIALLVAVATIAAHAFRVARANPIHALRYE